MRSETRQGTRAVVGWLERVDVLSRASRESLSRVARVARIHEVGPGHAICRQGEEPEAMWVVLDGQVRLEQDGEEIDTLGPGQAVGAWSLLEPAPNIASVTAVERCRLLRVACTSYRQLDGRDDIERSIRGVIRERLLALAGAGG